MVNLLLILFVILLGSSVAFTRNDIKLNNRNSRRISRNIEHQRPLRTMMGKLIDTETNTIYTVDGQKQQGTSSNTGAAAEALAVGPSTRFLEDLACLEACYKCVEDYPLATVNFLILELHINLICLAQEKGSR